MNAGNNPSVKPQGASQSGADSAPATGNRSVVQEALEFVYGKGPMVAGCAAEVAKRLGTGVDDVLHDVHMVIWNWFPGGTTAEMAANKVMEAVQHPGRGQSDA